MQMLNLMQVKLADAVDDMDVMTAVVVVVGASMKLRHLKWRKRTEALGTGSPSSHIAVLFSIYDCD